MNDLFRDLNQMNQRILNQAKQSKPKKQLEPDLQLSDAGKAYLNQSMNDEDVTDSIVFDPTPLIDSYCEFTPRVNHTIVHNSEKYKFYSDMDYNFFIKTFIDKHYNTEPKIMSLNTVKYLKRCDFHYSVIKFVEYKPKLGYDIFSLDADLLYSFLYLTIKYQFLMDDEYTDKPELLPTHNYIFKTLHEEFKQKKNWDLDVYVYDDISILWNPYMVAFLKVLKHKVIIGLETLELDVECELVQYDIFEYYPNLREIATNLINFRFDLIKDVNILKLHQCVHESLVLTGTACVGKTYLQRSLQKECKIQSFKHTLLGGFKNKDDSQINALLYQISGFANLSNALYVSDRGPLDNFIWRIIMHLIGIHDIDKIIDEFMKIMSQINHFVFSGLNKKPWVFILENNEQENRKRMLNRNEGGDYFRAYLPHYVKLQNMVYGTIGILCGSTVVTNNYISEIKPALSSYLNEAKRHLQIGDLIKYEFKRPNTMKNFDSENYKRAKALNVFK